MSNVTVDDKEHGCHFCRPLIDAMAQRLYERLVEHKEIELRNVIGETFNCENVEPDEFLAFSDRLNDIVWIECNTLAK